MVRREFFIPSAVAFAVAAGLSGCSDGNTDAAPKAATPSEPATVSATPTPTAPPPPATPYPHPTPEEPQGMYQHTDGGAIATAQYFVELIGYQASTGNTSKMEKISLPECEYCKHQIDYVKHVASIHGWADNYRTNGLDLQGYGPPGNGKDGDLAVLMNVQIPEYKYYVPDEDGLGKEKAYDLKIAVVLKWAEDRWMVLDAGGTTDP